MGRKLTKLEKYGLIAAVITGMLFFYLKNIYDPQQASLEQSRERLNRTIQEFNRLQAAEPLFQLRQTLNSRNEELAGLEQTMAELDTAPDGTTDMRMVRYDLYQDLNNRSLRIIQVSPAGTRKELFTWHVFNIRAKGDYSGFISLMRQLQEYESPVRIGKITVEGESAPWPLNIGLELWLME